MTEKDWGDLESLPAQKPGAPKWLWFCGCGCLVMLLAVLGAGWGSFRWVRSGIQGPERWERLAEVLPYDERPQGYALTFAQKLPFVEVEVFLFTPEASSDGDGDDDEAPDSSVDEAQIESEVEPEVEPGAEPEVEPGSTEDAQPGEDEADPEEGSSRRRRKVARDLPFFVITAMGEEMSREALPELSRADGEPNTTITVQGRELLAVRLEDDPPPSLRGLPRHQQPTLMVHLTPEGGTRGVFLLAGREASDAPVEPDEVVKFLAGFHVGPDR